MLAPFKWFSMERKLQRNKKYNMRKLLVFGIIILFPPFFSHAALIEHKWLFTFEDVSINDPAANAADFPTIGSSHAMSVFVDEDAKNAFGFDVPIRDARFAHFNWFFEIDDNVDTNENLSSPGSYVFRILANTQPIDPEQTFVYYMSFALIDILNPSGVVPEGALNPGSFQRTNFEIYTSAGQMRGSLSAIPVDSASSAVHILLGFFVFFIFRASRVDTSI